MTVIMDGRSLANRIKEDLRLRVEKLKSKKIQPSLVVIMVGENSASKVYVRNKKLVADKIGIKTTDVKFSENTSEKQILETIENFNKDEKVDGILVQLPLPKHINEKKITQAILPSKDVDGFHPTNMGHLFMNTPQSLPCTPRGIMEILKEYKINLVGKKTVIIGRSNIVGRPMAALMINADATVTITHSKTKNLKDITKGADILIVAVGKADFIERKDIKKRAVIIDVGMNRDSNGKLVGDVSKNVIGVAGYLTPVPGGVGPMTIAMLMRQTVEFAEKRA